MKTCSITLLVLISQLAFAADKKITDFSLWPAGSYNANDVIPIVDITNGVTKKTRISDFDTRYVVSPITSTGTITAGVWNATTIAIANGGTGLSSTSQNFVFIGPTSGSGAPSWRTLVAGDLPIITVAKGGTGLATLTAHSVQLGNGTGTVTQLAVGQAGTVLSGVAGGDPTFSNQPVLGSNSGGYSGQIRFQGLTSGVLTMAIQDAAGTYNFNLPITAGSAGTVLTSQGGGSTAMTWSSVITNPATAAYDTLYQNTGNTTLDKLPNGTTGQYYKATTSGAPSWANLPVTTTTLATPIRVEYANMNANCTTGTCAVATKSGGISTITFNSTGNYTVNFSPSFGGAPACTCSGDETGIFAGLSCGIQSPSTSSAIAVLLNGAVATNGRLQIICVGQN